MPKTPDKPKKNGDSPKTEIAQILVFYAGVLLLALAGLSLLIIRMRKKISE